MTTVYKDVYLIGKKLPKADKLGLHTLLQNKILSVLENAVSAAFCDAHHKKPYLEKIRTLLEVGKHLLRTENELGIITESTYIRIAKLLIEASRMNAGWLKNTDERTKNSLF